MPSAWILGTLVKFWGDLHRALAPMRPRARLPEFVDRGFFLNGCVPQAPTQAAIELSTFRAETTVGAGSARQSTTRVTIEAILLLTLPLC